MPLIVMCGYPSSGKSHWSLRLKEFLTKEKGKEVVIVGEEEFFRFEKNLLLDDSRKEKELRAKVKSEVQRLLSKDNVVVVDALNYIKGYRYELFCLSKGVPTTQVTVQPDVSPTQGWEWNLTRPQEAQYQREVFDHLISRFEAPDPQNRWDSPLFTVLQGEELDMEGIYKGLFQTKSIPKQNQSTKHTPVSESNYLHSLEKITSDIVQAILTEQKTKEEEDSSCFDEGVELSVPHSSTTVNLSYKVTLAQLTKLKRQYVNLTKSSRGGGGGSGIKKGDISIGELFVQYLNSQLLGS